MLETRTGQKIKLYRDGKEVPQLRAGMSLDEAIALKGRPNDRMDVEGKTILIYKDVKLIFVDGKLRDIQ